MSVISREVGNYASFAENGLRPDLDPRTRPLDMGLITDIVHSADPLFAIREISQQYPYMDFLAPVNPLIFKSCIDDRKRIGKVVPALNGNLLVLGRPYNFELKTDKYLSNREMLGSRPLAGGRFGIDDMCLVESVLSGDAQTQPFWKQNGESFVNGFVDYVMQRSNRVCEGMRIPIHIDNEHGKVPVWIGSEDQGRPHYENIGELLNKMEGCGAHANFLALGASVVKLMGESGLSDELVGKMEATVSEKGVIKVPDYDPMVAKMLYKNAIDQGSPIDIMTGPHQPNGVVFSLRNVSLNRNLATLGLGQNNTFKVDLGVINMPNSTYSKVGQRVHEEYGNGFDWNRFTQFTVAHNLATLMTLEQENIPRFYIDKYTDFEYNGAK